MPNCRLLFPVCVLAGALIGCDEGVDPSGPFHGELIVNPNAGLLQEPPSAYKPAPAPTAQPASSAKPATPGDKLVRQAYDDLVNAIRDGEVELAIRAFESEQVAALKGDALDPIFATMELVDRIARRVDESRLNELLGPLRGVGVETVKVDLLDAQNGSASPNPTAVLLGPLAPTAALRFKLGPSGWKAQLEKPIEDADLAALQAYHTQLQDALNAILDWVRASANVDEAALKAAAAAAVRGEPLGLPEAAASEQDAPASAPSDPNDGESP